MAGGHAWWRVLATGFLLDVVALVLLVLTDNPNLFPTVVLVGNFLVPVTYVVFFYERRFLSDLPPPTTGVTFVYGGLLGVLAAGLLEPLLLRGLDVFTVLEIGLIEEFAKILGVLAIAGHQRHHEEMDGLILGAAAGMGFAALESTGYAFTAFLHSGGSLSAAVGVTLFRGLLAPMGHGTWTAILASVLFRESPGGRINVNRQVVKAYLTVAVLHGLWDGLPGVLAAFGAAGSGILIGEAAVAAAGFAILWLRWREARALQIRHQPLASVEGPRPSPSSVD
jgi:RsiW-degrading membrane proteinase PrsW (M82 family)